MWPIVKLERLNRVGESLHSLWTTLRFLAQFAIYCMTELSVSYSWCGRGARGEAVVGPFEIQQPLDPHLWPGQCVSNCRGGRGARGGAVVRPLESQLQCECIRQHLGFVRLCLDPVEGSRE